MTSWPFAHLTELAKKAECFETPEWAVEAILDIEVMTRFVLDPCCGRGVMAEAAKRHGYSVVATDLNDWGYGETGPHCDFLLCNPLAGSMWTLFMNPPFSKAQAFVEHARKLGFRKIVCFQRFAWYESVTRREFWSRNPPNRIYICESRADCWRIDIAPEDRGSSSPTAHAWFVWEEGHPAGTQLGRLEKGRAT